MTEVELLDESINYPIGFISTEGHHDLIEQTSIEEQRLTQILQSVTLTTGNDIKEFDQFLLSKPSINPLLIRYTNYHRINGLTDDTPTSTSSIDSGDLGFIAGYDLLKNKEMDAALHAFEKCENPKSQYFNHARYYSGLILILQSDFDQAYIELSKIGKTYELMGHLPYYLAICHVALKRYQEVIKWYEPRLKERTLHHYDKLKELVAISHYKVGNFNKSLKYLSKDKHTDLYITALQKSSGDKELIKQFGATHYPKLSIYARSIIGESLYHMGHYQQSIDTYSSVMHGQHQDKVNYNIAQSYIALHQYDKAITHLSLIKGEGIKAQANDLIASLVINSDLLNSDLLDYHMISRLSSMQKNMLLNQVLYKGRLALSNDDMNPSLQYLSLAEKIDRGAQQAKLLLADIGWSYFTIGKYKEAKTALQKAIKSSAFIQFSTQDKFKAHYAMSYISLSQNDAKRALGSLSIAQDLASDSDISAALREDVYNRIGDCYFALDDYPNAQSAFQEAFSFRTKQGDYALYQLGIIQKLNGNPYEQIMIYEELIHDYPNSAYTIVCNSEIGDRYFELGQYDNAKKFYKTIEHVDDPSIRNSVQLQLGLIYVNAGDYDTAEQYYQKVLRNNHSQDYMSSARKALQELYSSYKIDVDSYAMISLANSVDNNEDAIKLDFAIEQYHNGTYDIALRELDYLRSRSETSDLLEQIDYYTALIMIKSENKLQAALDFCEKYSYDNYSDLTSHIADGLMQQKRYEDYITSYEKGWFDAMADTHNKLIIALIHSNQSDRAILKIEESEADLPKTILENELIQLVTNLAKDHRWNDLIKLNDITQQSTLWTTHPKVIYIRALSLFNVNLLDQSIKHVTEHYDRLVLEPSWFAKATLLLSDCYYIKGEKTMAIAALEAMLQSELRIPPTLLDQAKSQLTELNL